MKKKVEKLKIKKTKQGDNLPTVLVALAKEMVSIKEKINEIIDHLNK